MAPKKKIRDFLGILKDKATLIRISLSTRRTTSSIRLAVLRCTTHFSSSPPPDHRIAVVLSLNNGSRPTALACTEAIMDRLHNSHNAYVALKCLFTLHHIVATGSFDLKDHNSLNLSMFFDKSDVESLEISLWVRWYAGALERYLITNSILGRIEGDSMNLLNYDLMREIEALVNFVEEICTAPDSIHYQRINLVFEIVRMVSEDYRLSQHYMMTKLGELERRVERLREDELEDLTRCLNRLEACRERLTLLFGNRKRNDAFWELVSETNGAFRRKIEEDREKRVVKYESESTRLIKRVAESDQVMRLLPYGGELQRSHLKYLPV
jgi:hypothetical protein